MLTRANALDLPTVTWRALSQRAPRRATTAACARSRGRSRSMVRSVDGRGVPVQVDGDYIGEDTEARFAVAAGALRVVA